MTQAEALDWVSKQIGKSLDYDGHYGPQCMDLIGFYTQFLGHTLVKPQARLVWEQGIDSWYSKVGSPQPGDIVVFKPNAGNGQSGHIAVVYQVNAGSIRSLDQNWVNASLTNGSPAAWVNHPIDGSIYGYVRPQFNGGQDMADKINQNTSRILQHGILARNGLTGRAYSLDGSTGDPWVGGDLTNQFIQDIFNSPEASNWRDSTSPASVKDINARLAQLDAVTKELDAERTSYDDQIRQLKAQLAAAGSPQPVDPNSITITKDGLWDKIKKFLTGA